MQSTRRLSPFLLQAQREKYLAWCKNGIWVYFWLLIFEGALRKWVVPQLSAPLLLVRDPAAIFIYWSAIRSRCVPSRDMALFAALSFSIILLAIVQTVSGIDDAMIAVFGVRSYLLHLPLIFVIKYVFTSEDVKKLGRYLLLLSIPMTLLIIAQYRAPANSWLNNGAGGTTGGQLYFSGDHVRASGTFSFVSGISQFFPVVWSFLLFAIAEARTYPKWLVRAAGLACIVVLPASGSRSLLFAVAMVALCAILSLLSSAHFLDRMVKVGAAALVGTVICYQLPVFRDSLVSFTERWQTAQASEGDNGAQGTLKLRLLDSILDSVGTSLETPLLGNGIGLGSNVAAVARTGEQGFTLAESEWIRVVQECGPIIGLSFLGYRILLCANLVGAGLKLRRRGSVLGLLVASAAVPQLLFSTVEQPTNLGFMVFISGICLAATTNPRYLLTDRRRQITKATPQRLYPILTEN